MWRFRPILTILLLAFYVATSCVGESLHVMLAHGAHSSSLCCRGLESAETDEITQGARLSDSDSTCEHDGPLVRDSQAPSCCSNRTKPLVRSCQSSELSFIASDLMTLSTLYTHCCKDCRICQLLNQAQFPNEIETWVQLEIPVCLSAESRYVLAESNSLVSARPRAPPATSIS